MPGKDWLILFLKRDDNIISKIKCQNINRKRAAVSIEMVFKYSDILKKTL